MNRDLLEYAYAIIDGIPDERIDLETYSSNGINWHENCNPHHCGTIGCPLGWLGMHPYFQALGLQTRGTYITLSDIPYDFVSVGKELFNITKDQSGTLFGPRRDRKRSDKRLSDKQVFQARMRALLQLAGT